MRYADHYYTVRDGSGFACGICRSGLTVLHLVPGTVINEENADLIVLNLNRLLEHDREVRSRQRKGGAK